MPPVTSLCHMSSHENPGDSGLVRGLFMRIVSSQRIPVNHPASWNVYSMQVMTRKQPLLVVKGEGNLEDVRVQKPR